MKYGLIVFLLMIGKICQGQANKIDFNKYNFVDTIKLAQDSYIAIGYGKVPDDESILVYKRNGNFEFYPLVLTCLDCMGRGTIGGTYGGYKKNGTLVTFIQKYFCSIDSISIDFKPKIPVYKKIVRHDYASPKETPHSVDYAGHYLFTPKGSVPITLISTPFDREDDSVKKYFFIKKIKYVDLMK